MAEDKKVITIQYDVDSKEVVQSTKIVQDNTQANKTNSDSVEGMATAQKSFKTQLREANEALKTSIQMYGETSKEAIQAAKGVANLKDQMGFAKDLADAFNPDQKMKALGAATQIAATGMQGVTAGMALFGDQSEDTEKMLLKVQAAMAFSDAISGLSNLGDQWQNLKAVIASAGIQQKIFAVGTVLAATAQKAFTGSVTATSTGFKILRGAIIATGIGALVVGIGMLIANFDKVKKVALNLVPGLANIGDAIMNIVNAVTDFIGVTSEAGRALDKQKEMAEKSLAQNERYLKRNENTLTDYQKRTIELVNQHNKRIADGEFSQSESLKILHEARAKDARLAQEKENEASIEAAKKANEKHKAERDKAAADEKAAREKVAAERKAFEESVRAEQGAMTIREIEQKAADKLERDEELVNNLQSISDQVDAIELVNEKQTENEKKNNDDALKEQERVNEAKVQMATDSVNTLANIANLLNLKGKAGQAVSKGLALTQIGIDTASAISKAIPASIHAGKEAGTVAGPAAAVVTPAVTASTYIGLAAMITSNALRAKAVLSGGSASGGSSGGSTGNATSSRIEATASPQVGFQQSQSAQIAGSINQANKNNGVVNAVINLSDLNEANKTNIQQKSASSFG